VLREVVAAGDGQTGAAQHSTSSLLFDSPRVTDEPLVWGHLPTLRVDDSDPQAGWLRTVSVDDPVARLAVLQAAPTSSAEVLLATGRAALEGGRTDIVASVVRDMLAADPWEWRAVWLSGLAALGADDAAGAQAAFNAVYGQVPGELAPKLALALACETSGELDVAESLYATCARTDANYIAPAAFGLARIRATRSDLDGELAALDLVPPTSRAFTSARRQRAGLLADSGRGLPALAEAMGSIESLTIEPRERASLAVDVLQAALAQVLADGPKPDISIAGRPAVEPALRDGLEAAYRDLAGHAPTRTECVHLVDRANAVRRWSLR
jgi:serine/threonine-protein kinase PknG